MQVTLAGDSASKWLRYIAKFNGGNNEAAEHIWKTLTELLKNLIGFAISLMLLTNLNVILNLVVVLTSGVVFFVIRYINEWEVRHREEKEVCVKEIKYFRQRSYALDFASKIARKLTRMSSVFDFQSADGKLLRLMRDFLTSRGADGMNRQLLFVCVYG